MATPYTTAPATPKPVNLAVLDKIARAEPSAARRANIYDGEYIFEVHGTLSEDKRKGHCFIIELGVVESKPTNDPERASVRPNAPGTKCSSVVNFNGKGADAAPGNVQRFILGVLDIDLDNMLDEHGRKITLTPDEKAAEIKATYTDMVGYQQPCRGMLVKGETYCSTKTDGGLFVGVSWQGLVNNPEDVEIRRKLIDSGVVGSPLTPRERESNKTRIR